MSRSRSRELAEHCGVSSRTLQKAFADFARHHPRGARAQSCGWTMRGTRSQSGDAGVAEIAARCGFRSSTTFALEYRKRFGMAPSRTKRAARSQ